MRERESDGLQALTEQESPHPFGALLKSHRTKLGYSQEVLAERAGISVAAVGAIEQNFRRAPYRQTIASLARALDLSPSEAEAFEQAAARARNRALRRDTGAITRADDNLPTPLAPFISRVEVEQICALIELSRLVTITGPGGVGKTRTAIEVASRQSRKPSDGVRFVDLSSVRDSNVIGAEIASVVKIPLDGRDIALDTLVRALASRNLLFIVDNCEHLVASVATILRTILEKCPYVSIITTSREPLGLSNEVVFRLPSLQIPHANVSSLEQARGYSAIDLFLTRAHFADPHFAITADRIDELADICRTLDGIPLAIELAASQLPTLGLTELRSRLARRSDLPGYRSLPERHQTMAATVAWSFSLLDDLERTLLRRLSVFDGGFTLEAVEHACSGEALATPPVAGLLVCLVQKSLVAVVHVRKASHYRLLETIRAYASDKLRESGEWDLATRRHAMWLADFADHFVSDPAGTRIEDELPYIDNSRAAIRSCLSVDGEECAVLAGRIAGGLRRLWAISGRQAELVDWSHAALERIDEAKYPLVVARLYVALVASTWGDAMFAAADRALDLLGRVDDCEGAAAVRALLSLELCKRGRFAEAQATLQQALTAFTNPGRHERRTYLALLVHRSWISCAFGEFESARRDLAQVAFRLKKLGGDDDLERNSSITLAEIEFASGNVRLAADLCDDVVTQAGAATRGVQVTACLANLTCYRLMLGENEAAEFAGRQVLQNPGAHPLSAVETIQHLAALASIWRRSELAAKLLGFVDAWYLREQYVRFHTEKASYSILVDSLATQLSSAEIARLTAQGATLSLDDVKDQVLSMSPASDET